MRYVFISSCFIGFNIKYDGINNLRKEVVERLKNEYIFIFICFE